MSSTTACSVCDSSFPHPVTQRESQQPLVQWERPFETEGLLPAWITANWDQAGYSCLITSLPKEEQNTSPSIKVRSSKSGLGNLWSSRGCWLAISHQPHHHQPEDLVVTTHGEGAVASQHLEGCKFPPPAITTWKLKISVPDHCPPHPGSLEGTTHSSVASKTIISAWVPSVLCFSQHVMKHNEPTGSIGPDWRQQTLWLRS